MKFNFLILAFLFFASQAHAAFWIPDHSITNVKLSTTIVKAESAPLSNTVTSATLSVIGSVINITSTGRPVRLKLLPAYVSGGTISYSLGSIQVSSLSAQANGSVIFKRGATTLQLIQLLNNSSTSTSTFLASPCPGFEYIDFSAPAGANTYSIDISAVSGSTLTIGYCKLVAMEI